MVSGGWAVKCILNDSELYYILNVTVVRKKTI